MRNKKGQFVKGHSVLTIRDPANGRFVAGLGDKYTVVRQEVDTFLETKQLNISTTIY